MSLGDEDEDEVDDDDDDDDDNDELKRPLFNTLPYCIGIDD
jgi:hypothetical protein